MEKFQDTKVWKIRFTKNITKYGGAMDSVLEHHNKSGVMIISHTKHNGRMWASINNKTFTDLIKKNRGVYEIICQYPHRVYFDIDGDKTTNLQTVKKKIKELFGDIRMSISGSETEDKKSYHVVLPDIFVCDKNERELLKENVALLGYPFDWKVYTNNRNMKAINQSKLDGRIQTILENDNIQEHFITTGFKKKDINENITTKALILPYSVQIQQPINIGSIKQRVIKLPSERDLETAKGLFELLKNTKEGEYDHKFTFFVSRFCFGHNISFEEFWNFAKYKNSSNERYNKLFKQWNTLNKFSSLSNWTFKKTLERWYPNIMKGERYNRFCELFELGQTKEISTKVFEKTKGIVLNLPMGFGKTKQTIKYLTRYENKKILWITPRITLARNLLQRINAEHLDFALYQNYKDDKELQKCRKLICSTESLWKTGDEEYDIVVIDEIETVLMSWVGETQRKRSTNWARFKNVLCKADKVIFMDAFTTTRTIHLLEDLDINYTVFETNKRPTQRKVNIERSYKKWISNIHECIKQKQKVFIFYPTLSGCGNYPSIEELKQCLEKWGAEDVLCYHSKMSGETKKTLDDVSTNWENADVILTTSTITVGVNYEKLEYYKVFLGLGSWTSARDAIQSSYRLRQIISEEIDVHFLQTGKRESVKHRIDLNCSVFDKLQEGILTEWKCPVRQAFTYLCKKANFDIIQIDKVEVNEELWNYYKETLQNTECVFSYDNISDDIDVIEVEKKVWNDEATMEEQLAVNKFYYKQLFKENTPSEKLAEWWDKKKLSFFKTYIKTKNKKNNISKIQEFYGGDEWDFIQCDKEGLKELVNELYEFQNKSEKHSVYYLIKEALNNDFGCCIVEFVDKKDNRHSIQFTDLFYELSKDAEEYLYNWRDHQLFEADSGEDSDEEEYSTNPLDFGLSCYIST